MSVCIAASKVDEALRDQDVVLHVGDLFYVINRSMPNGLWRVKPISHTGREILVPADRLEIDPNGLQRLQNRYGQKVYFGAQADQSSAAAATSPTGTTGGGLHTASPTGKAAMMQKLAAIKTFSARSLNFLTRGNGPE